MKIEIQLMNTTKAQPISPTKNMPSSRYQTINLNIIVATHQVVFYVAAETEYALEVMSGGVYSASRTSRNLYKGIVLAESNNTSLTVYTRTLPSTE